MKRLVSKPSGKIVIEAEEDRKTENVLKNKNEFKTDK